jgi:DNA-binding transcriptional ArsR family regulator
LTQTDPRLDRLFQALSDPTRRAVLARLSAGPVQASVLAEPFGMALPSFMEHLKKLEDGGLIETRKEGRVRWCSLKPGALDPARDWIEEQRALWNARLDSLEDYLANLMKERNR